MLKADLHLHSSEDPQDTGFAYDARMLIDRAATLGFNAIALTNHRAVSHTPALARYARQRGILLIPGCEAEIDGKHLLLLNVTEKERRQVHTFDDLRALRRRRGKTMLCIVPHPCFPSRSSMGQRRVRKNADVFDAIELSQYGEGIVDLNRRAARLANDLGKPLVASSDAHSFRFFGKIYTNVDGKATVQDVLDAIRGGHARPVVQRLSKKDFTYLFWHALKMFALKYAGFESNDAF